MYEVEVATMRIYRLKLAIRVYALNWRLNNAFLRRSTQSKISYVSQFYHWFWSWWYCSVKTHYHDVTMGTMASQITSLAIIYSSVYSDADQRKHQSSASLAFVRSPHKGPVTRKMFPFDDVIMKVFSIGTKFWNQLIVSPCQYFILPCQKNAF